MTPATFYRVKACGPHWCTPDQWEELCILAEEYLKQMHGFQRMLRAEQQVAEDIAGKDPSPPPTA